MPKCEKTIIFQMSYKGKDDKAKVRNEMKGRVERLNERHKGENKIYYRLHPIKKSYYAYMLSCKR